MRDEAKANEEKDKAEKERIDKINAADSNIFTTEKQLKEYGEKLPADKKAAIETALHRLQMLRELAFAELRDRGSLYRTCGIAAGLLVILVLV